MKSHRSCRSDRCRCHRQPCAGKSADAVQRCSMCARASSVMNANAAVTAPDPYGVYVDGREIGRDPDPNIRSSLRDEYYELQGQ